MSYHHHRRRHAFNVYDPLEPQKWRRGREKKILSIEEPPLKWDWMRPKIFCGLVFE